jgi:outer membrane lipoprotein SlyB
MLRTTKFIALLAATTVGLSACVPPPPRHRVVYRESDRTYDRRVDDRDRYDDARYDDRECRFCGTVRDIERVEVRPGNSGGGAVLGAIIGGLIGNQFGHGSGRAAATAAGVVGGAAVGNSVEENNGRAYSGSAWRFHVELDDGHWARVTQADNPGFHPGDRVVIRGDHLEPGR